MRTIKTGHRESLEDKQISHRKKLSFRNGDAEGMKNPEKRYMEQESHDNGNDSESRGEEEEEENAMGDIRRSFKNVQNVSVAEFRKKMNDLKWKNLTSVRSKSMDTALPSPTSEGHSAKTVHMLEQLHKRPYTTGGSQHEKMRQAGSSPSSLEHISNLGALPRTPGRRNPMQRSNSEKILLSGTVLAKSPSKSRNTPARGNLKFSTGNRLSLSSFDESDGVINLLTTREETDGFVRGMKMVEMLNQSRTTSTNGRRRVLQRSQLLRSNANGVMTPNSHPDENHKSRLSDGPNTPLSSFPERMGPLPPNFPLTSTYSNGGHDDMQSSRSEPMASRQQQQQQHQYQQQQNSSAAITDVTVDPLLHLGEEVEEDENGYIQPLHFSDENLRYDDACLEPLRLQYDPGQVKPITLKSNNTISNVIRDYKLMANACNRGGRNRMEAICHHKLGTLYEEKRKPTPAIRHYKALLSLSRTMNDESGISLGLNCLGVVYQILGGRHLHTALQYHQMHLELADTQGKIVAHINIGLTYRRMGDDESAAENHRAAFQYALEINDRQGESLALANLGLLGMGQGDLLTAQACIERQLHLSESMKDGRSMSDALQKLGQLAGQKGESGAALNMLDRSRQVAITNGDHSKANEIKVNIGIVNGQMKFDQYIRQLVHLGQEQERMATNVAQLPMPKQ